MLLEAVVRIYSSKISQYSQENTCVGVSLFKKVATLLKGDSDKDVFL